MKVLLLVPLCATTVGEELLYYKLTKALSENFDATVIAMHRYSDPTSVAQLLPAARVFESEAWPTHRLNERLNALAKPNYVKFYWFARRKIAELLRRERFDIAHQIGPMATRYPTPLYRFNIPYIIGPVGGALPTPPAFRDAEGAFPWYYRLKDLDGMRFAADPYLRRSYGRAQAVVGTAPYVSDTISRMPIKRTEYVSESALDELPQLPVRDSNPQRFRLLHISRAIRTKGLLYLVRAMAQVKGVPGLHLDAIGDGPDLAACKALAAELGVENLITFHGQKRFAELAEFYARADLFLYPSFREAGGSALFEAMAYGLPVVCAAYGAPSYNVKDAFGIRVPVDSQAGFVSGLASAIRTLRDAPERRAQMGRAARREIEERHLWPARVAFFSELYASVLSTSRS